MFPTNIIMEYYDLVWFPEPFDWFDVDLNALHNQKNKVDL